MRILAPVLLLACVLVAGPVPAEMFKYTDSKGRIHFTQDIGQVPPEYRNQVQKQKLGREISVTGSANPSSQRGRLEAMEERSRRLKRTTRHAQPSPAAPAKPSNPLAGAPAPTKYREFDCHWRNGHRRCQRSLTEAWKRWDAANGGNNGRAVTRRRVGK